MINQFFSIGTPYFRKSFFNRLLWLFSPLFWGYSCFTVFVIFYRTSCISRMYTYFPSLSEPPSHSSAAPIWVLTEHRAEGDAACISEDLASPFSCSSKWWLCSAPYSASVVPLVAVFFLKAKYYSVWWRGIGFKLLCLEAVTYHLVSKL